MNTTLAFVDLETTGLDPFRNEILEIGVVLYRPETDTHTEWSVKVKPERIEDAHPKALEINGYTEKAWTKAVTIEHALKELNKKCGPNATFLAYNATFDWSFLEVASARTGIALPFQYHRLCVMSMARKLLRLPSYTLKNVCEHLQIPPEPSVHRALNGARNAYEVYLKLKV